MINLKSPTATTAASATCAHATKDGLPLDRQVLIHLDFYPCGVLKKILVEHITTCDGSEYAHAIKYLDSVRKSSMSMHPEARQYLALIVLHLARLENATDAQRATCPDASVGGAWPDKPGCDHG